jgi:hypothetical protein
MGKDDLVDRFKKSGAKRLMNLIGSINDILAISFSLNVVTLWLLRHD